MSLNYWKNSHRRLYTKNIDTHYYIPELRTSFFFYMKSLRKVYPCIIQFNLKLKNKKNHCFYFMDYIFILPLHILPTLHTGELVA